MWPCLLLTFQRLISPPKNRPGALLFSLFFHEAWLWPCHFSNFSTWNRQGNQKQWRPLYLEFSQKQISKAIYNFRIHRIGVKWNLGFLLQFFLYVYVMVFCFCFFLNDFGYYCIWALPRHCEMKKIWRSVSTWCSQCSETDRVLEDMNYISLLFAIRWC